MTRPGEGSSDWTLELLRSIEWKRFEELCAAYFRQLGYVAKTQTHGADGGVDIRLFETEGGPLIAVAQCKAWNSSDIDAATVREMIGTMVSERTNRGFLLATGRFSSPAEKAAINHGLDLIDGKELIRRINALPTPVQSTLRAVATEGDYTTPTCVNCGIKMVDRVKFWGCPNFPRCRQQIYKKATDTSSKKRNIPTGVHEISMSSLSRLGSLLLTSLA